MKRKWTEEQRKKFKATMKAKKSAKVKAPPKSDVPVAIGLLRRAVKTSDSQVASLYTQLALVALEGRL